MVTMVWRAASCLEFDYTRDDDAVGCSWGSRNVKQGIGGSDSGSSGTSAGQNSCSTALILRISREAFEKRMSHEPTRQRYGCSSNTHAIRICRDEQPHVYISGHGTDR